LGIALPAKVTTLDVPISEWSSHDYCDHPLPFVSEQQRDCGPS
jgi:hypothetical protein